MRLNIITQFTLIIMKEETPKEEIARYVDKRCYNNKTQIYIF